MPKKVDIALPAHHTDALVAEIRDKIDLIGIKVYKNVSVKPSGDHITSEVTDTALARLMELLSQKGLLESDNVSVSTSKPLSILSRPSSRNIVNDASEATWEEMLSMINHDSNMSVNGVVVMFIAGALATVGLVTNALHLIIGAMVIAPGFEPIVRISLGAISQNAQWKKGVVETFKGYIWLLAGALVCAWLLQTMDKDIIGGEPSYLARLSMIKYVTQLSDTSILVTVISAIAGTIVIAAHRSVLTAGVMIALVLVPSMAVVGIGLVAGDFSLAGKALLRWSIEVVGVLVLSAVVLLLKKRFVHKRRMSLK